MYTLQLVHMKIILNIEKSQLHHTFYDDPQDLWENIEKVHCAHGFATQLSLCCHFLYIHKHDDQPLSSWVSDIKNTAFQLESTRVSVINEEIILSLTEGLPNACSILIVALDIPLHDLSLSNVVTQLLNEEV